MSTSDMISTKVVVGSEPERPEILLAGPWKNRRSEKILTSWGSRLDRKALEAVALLRDGGWWHHTFPPFAETMAYAVKASKHLEAAHYLHLLCEAALASQYSLTECALLIRECMGLDPVRELSPRDWANEWSLLLITFTNVWEARQNSVTVPCTAMGDDLFLVHFIQASKIMLGEAQIVQMERDMEDKKQKIRGGNPNA